MAMSIYLMMGFAVAMTIGFLVFNIPILRLMNSPAELMDDVAGYMGIIYAGLLVTAAYNTLAAFYVPLVILNLRCIFWLFQQESTLYLMLY